MLSGQVRRTRSLSSASLLSEPFGLFQAVERRLTDGSKGGGGAHPMALEAVLQQARTALQVSRKAHAGARMTSLLMLL